MKSVEERTIDSATFEALVNRLYWRYYLIQAVEIVERLEKLVESYSQYS